MEETRNPRRIFSFWVLASCLSYTVALARFAFGASTFLGDDLLNFAAARDTPFFRFIATPMDVHPVPLHRLVNYLIARDAPGRFWLAMTLLTAFQSVAIVCLHATLELLKPARANALFVAWYATHFYLVTLFLWWTAGLHRLPYVCFLSTAAYFYVRYRKEHRPRDSALVFLSIALALGFFEKGLLIPVFLVGIEVCLFGSTSPGDRKANARLLSLLLLVACAYFLLWQRVVGSEWSAVVTDPRFLWDYLKGSWRMLGESTVGRVNDGAALAATVWAVLVVAAVVRARSALVVFVVGLAAVSLSLVVTGLSAPRSGFFGVALPYIAHRYYPDAMFVLTLFTAIAWQCGTKAEEPVRAPELRDWVTSLALFAATAGLSLSAYRGSTRWAPGTYPNHGTAHAFMQTFGGELARLRAAGAPLRFVEGPGAKCLELRQYGDDRTFLDAIGVEASFASPGPGVYRIDESGLVVPSEARRPRRRRRARP